MRHLCLSNISALFILLSASCASALECGYYKPGDLIAGSGEGAKDDTNFAPHMVSPFADDMPTTKSAILNPGGYLYPGGGDQCEKVNFDNNNRDTFCENRGKIRTSWNCSKKKIHQGIDINGGTPKKCKELVKAAMDVKNGGPISQIKIVPVRAVVDGKITGLGTYSITLRDDTSEAQGTIQFRYLHMEKRTLQVKQGDNVKAGDTMGYMYNEFGGTATKFHLHLEIIADIDGDSFHVNPYLPFVRSVEKEFKVTCKER